MTKMQTKEQAENIQRGIYETKFKKPAFPLTVRKAVILANKRLQCQLQINVTELNGKYSETFKINRAIGESIVNLTISSFYGSGSRLSRLVKSPSTRKDYNNYRKDIYLINNKDDDKDKLNYVEYFLDSIEKLMSLKYNFYCDKLSSNEFYFVIESDEELFSLELYITL